MATDSAGGSVLLVNPDGETWSWDGLAWMRRHPKVSPSPRIGAGIASDTNKELVVLFGGFDADLGVLLNDTWTWDGQEWTQQSPNHCPPPLASSAMAWNSQVGAVVLFSGMSSVMGAATADDTWVWDGVDWTIETPTVSPEYRWNASMVPCPTAGGLLLFGGFDPSGGLNDDWKWTATA